MELDAALGLIDEIPDFPEPGVLFRDLSPLFAHGEGFAAVTDALAATVEPDVERLVAVEARGFVLAAAVGYARGLGVVLVRKPGKLPSVAGRIDYALEYGTATLELPGNVAHAGLRVTVVDDVLATGGTADAACRLLEEAGATVAGISVVLELAALDGRAALPGRKVSSLQIV
jgi:adenine phosphoribosyltransferase